MEKNEKIVIRADPEISNLIPGYLENRRKDIEKMREALEKSDYETIGFIGHSMKGSGQGYGFGEISAIGHKLEEAANDKNARTITGQIDELHNYLQRIEVVYEWTGKRPG